MYLHKTFCLFVTIIFISSACNSTLSDREKVFQQLKENQAQISYQIDNKNFYPQESIFTGEVHVSNKLLSMTLDNQFDGKTIISFGGEKWYKQVPVSKQLFVNNEINAGIKMGRLTNKEKMIGEAYMMSEGEMTLEEFSKDRIVISIEGKAGKYSDFKQPDTLLIVKGNQKSDQH